MGRPNWYDPEVRHPPTCSCSSCQATRWRGYKPRPPYRRRGLPKPFILLLGAAIPIGILFAISGVDAIGSRIDPLKDSAAKITGRIGDAVGDATQEDPPVQTTINSLVRTHNSSPLAWDAEFKDKSVEFTGVTVGISKVSDLDRMLAKELGQDIPSDAYGVIQFADKAEYQRWRRNPGFLGFSGPTVACGLKEGDVDDFAPIRRGDEVTISGTARGVATPLLFGDKAIGLRDCAIVSHGPNVMVEAAAEQRGPRRRRRRKRHV